MTLGPAAALTLRMRAQRGTRRVSWEGGPGRAVRERRQRVRRWRRDRLWKDQGAKGYKKGKPSGGRGRGDTECEKGQVVERMRAQRAIRRVS